MLSDLRGNPLPLMVVCQGGGRGGAAGPYLWKSPHHHPIEELFFSTRGNHVSPQEEVAILGGSIDRMHCPTMHPVHTCFFGCGREDGARSLEVCTEGARQWGNGKIWGGGFKFTSF